MIHPYYAMSKKNIQNTYSQLNSYVIWIVTPLSLHERPTEPVRSQAQSIKWGISILSLWGLQPFDFGWPNEWTGAYQSKLGTGSSQDCTACTDAPHSWRGRGIARQPWTRFEWKWEQIWIYCTCGCWSRKCSKDNKVRLDVDWFNTGDDWDWFQRKWNQIVRFWVVSALGFVCNFGCILIVGL